MCSLYCKYKCRLLNSMECDSCTQLGWTDSSMHFWNTCKMCFFGLCDWRSVSFLVWFAFPLFLLLMCLFLHSTCFGVAFFSIHCLSLDCREDFQTAKVKSWKAAFSEQYFKSTQCKLVFSIFLYFTCPSFYLQLYSTWTRGPLITENVLCGINKVEVIKT